MDLQQNVGQKKRKPVKASFIIANPNPIELGEMDKTTGFLFLPVVSLAAHAAGLASLSITPPTIFVPVYLTAGSNQSTSFYFV
jgi:hypothetical protein